MRAPSVDTSTRPALPTVGKTRTWEEGLADGRRAAWGTATASDGRALLHGWERWYYPDGRLQYEARYDRGRLTGRERFLREDGSPAWSRDHRKDGATVWTRYWPNGRKRTESTWRDQRAEGTATAWDVSGKVIHRVTFRDGVPAP